MCAWGRVLCARGRCGSCAEGLVRVLCGGLVVKSCAGSCGCPFDSGKRTGDPEPGFNKCISRKGLVRVLCGFRIKPVLEKQTGSLEREAKWIVQGAPSSLVRGSCATKTFTENDIACATKACTRPCTRLSSAYCLVRVLR